MSVFAPELDLLEHLEPRAVRGTVAAVRGLSVLVDDLPLPIGATVRLETDAAEPLRGAVVGFDGAHAVVMLYGAAQGLAPATTVVGERLAPTVGVGSPLLGRVIDALGRPIDGGPAIRGTTPVSIEAMPTNAMHRPPVHRPLPTGVRVVDAMTTIGRGQRIGIFSGPGVGKSTLVASIAKHTAADVSVIALIGERGREVRTFIESTLGPEGLARSVVVVATSDESPLLRVRAARVACCVAEHFRDAGKDVLLAMDSITRFAQAQRQIGLTVGEQPATKGYTPSVFALMPELLERAGALDGQGSITGLYAVLVEGDDLSEPISDAARGILDGHIALSRKLAGRGHYPAVDVLESISRVADDVCDEPHIAARRVVRRLMAAWSESEELITIGAYARGSNPHCDVAIDMKPAIDAFLNQEDEACPYPETCRRLLELSLEAQQRYDRLAAPGAGG